MVETGPFERCIDSLALGPRRCDAEHPLDAQQPRYGQCDGFRGHVIERGKTRVIHLLLAAFAVKRDHLDIELGH